jgi:transglutaminase-like putative cysteine protease
MRLLSVRHAETRAEAEVTRRLDQHHGEVAAGAGLGFQRFGRRASRRLCRGRGRKDSRRRTLDLLKTMNAALKPQIVYGERHAPGTQAPAETLETKTGACRDFAMALIEAARYLGFGARFVSGYLYDPDLDKGDATQAVAATHTWAEIYLPGAGWIEYDPTDVLIGHETLIRVAVTRDPSQAIPISGSYAGSKEDFLGMDVAVTVTAQG